MELFDVAPRALTKLRSKAGDVTKLFKSEVHAIAYRYFATTLDGKLKYGHIAAALEELIKSRPGVLAPPPSVGGIGSRQQKQRLRAPRRRSRPPSRGGCRRSPRCGGARGRSGGRGGGGRGGGGRSGRRGGGGSGGAVPMTGGGEGQ